MDERRQIIKRVGEALSRNGQKEAAELAWQGLPPIVQNAEACLTKLRDARLQELPRRLVLELLKDAAVATAELKAMLVANAMCGHLDAVRRALAACRSEPEFPDPVGLERPAAIRELALAELSLRTPAGAFLHYESLAQLSAREVLSVASRCGELQRGYASGSIATPSVFYDFCRDSNLFLHLREVTLRVAFVAMDPTTTMGEETTV